MAHVKKLGIWDPALVRAGVIDAFRKLDPRVMVRNPVMFVVEVGAVLTSVLLVRDLLEAREGVGFELQITLWLWITVLFANLAEAMAEGRGKAQADTLRKTRPTASSTETSRRFPRARSARATS
jgi:K+-transporting ATPase ATPase B chain